LPWGATARVVLVDDPTGGRPSAVASLAADAPSNTIAALNGLPPTAAVISVGEEIPAVAPLQVADPTLATPSERTPLGSLADLVEETEFGAIPRVSAAGEKPFDAYARPALAAGSGPQIAILVSGLGLNLDGTLRAVGALPDDVTLGFAPYGKNLRKGLEAARAEGHELFLELPLEPFDYPDSDPGPDTLLTGQPPRDNLSRLFAVLARAGGYVGLMNFMGARFTASSADFGPIMEEIGARGLGYLDDGSSNRSVARELAASNGVPFARIDRPLDLKPSRAAILAELDALEAVAREEGRAIGIVSALPVSIDTIAEWAAGLAERNIRLVPASALMKG
jgi:uncharacterized protein